MRKLHLLLCAILIILTGCSNSNPQNNIQDKTDIEESTAYSEEIKSEDSISFLKNYSELMDYYIFKFASEDASKVTYATVQYLSSASEKVITDSENAVDDVKRKLNELEDVDVIEGLGLSEKHSVVLKAKSNYEDSADSLISAMKDKCNTAEWSEKRDNISSAIDLLRQACMDAKNQADLKLYELGAVKNDIDNAPNPNNAMSEDNQSEAVSLSPPNTGEIIPITEDDTLSNKVSITKHIFDEYTSSEHHSENYSYLVAGKYSYNNIEYYVIQAGTPESMNEYYLVDSFSNNDDEYLYPQVYRAGWGGIQTEMIELVYDTKLLKS